MLQASVKFHYLERAQGILPPGVVPSFERIPIQGESPVFSKPSEKESYILRSALQCEGRFGKLLSGKSLTIGGITSIEDFEKSCIRVRAQQNLDSMILQREIPWDRHLTLWVDGDFFVGEQRDRDDRITCFFFNPLTRSHTGVNLEGLSDLLKRLRPILNESPQWVFEFGICHGQIHLFQLQPANPKNMEMIFSSGFALEQILAQSRFAKTATFLGMLRTEWNAHHFRKRMISGLPRISDVFLNWEFIFHYFRLHCLVTRENASAEAFAMFLSESSKSKSHLGGLLKKHLEISSRLRPLEPFPHLSAGFHSSTPLFIGGGRIEGILGVDILWHEEPDLEMIHSINPPKAILSSSVSILSHASLACSELGIGLVLGLPKDSDYSKINNATLQIDFHHKLITVKS
jgi:hypothetical protein